MAGFNLLAIALAVIFLGAGGGLAAAALAAMVLVWQYLQLRRAAERHRALARLTRLLERAPKPAGRLPAFPPSGFTARRDRIGRLCRALHRRDRAFHHRIDRLETYAADLVHELKTPLASLCSAQAGLQQITDPAKQAQLQRIIAQDLIRMDRLIKELSGAAGLERELAQTRQKPFDLLTALRKLSDDMRHEMERRNITFVADYPDGPLMICGIEAGLMQVFANLLGNAISFSMPGDAIRLWIRRRSGRVLVAVEDTGPGIPDGAQRRIFQRFCSIRAQADGCHSGLGLAISQQITEAHGGEIWAENIRPTEADIGSAPLGARFVVGLPA